MGSKNSSLLYKSPTPKAPANAKPKNATLDDEADPAADKNTADTQENLSDVDNSKKKRKQKRTRNKDTATNNSSQKTTNQQDQRW